MGGHSREERSLSVEVRPSRPESSTNHMPRADETLPLQRSYVEQRIGQLVGIFQIERKQLAEQIQRTMLEEFYFVPVFRHAFINAIGPRVAAKSWKDVFPTITSGYAYPWEDHELTS